MVSADWSLHCTACGRCCNSPPLLSLDELWQHRHTFIGCISVRRLPRNASAGQRALAAQLLPGGAADDLVLLLQGYQWASQPSCPALQSDQRCGVHGAHKPATCRVVPLDALLPDAEQALLLPQRAESAAFIGADCLQPNVAGAGQILLRQLQVVEPEYLGALQQRRADLARDRTLWGDALHAILRPELARSGRNLQDGYLSLPLVPLLAHLALHDAIWRERVHALLDAQIALIESGIAAALQRKDPRDRPATQEMRQFLTAYQKLRA
ncbi:hypothetical protein JCM19000A_07240 [Silvimonas sp. JCM 19000]